MCVPVHVCTSKTESEGKKIGSVGLLPGVRHKLISANPAACLYCTAPWLCNTLFSQCWDSLFTAPGILQALFYTLSICLTTYKTLILNPYFFLNVNFVIYL